MRPKTPKKWKKGDQITAARLNEMLDLILRLDISVPLGDQLRVQQSATGTILSMDMTGYGFLAVASASVAAGSGMSGGAPGATGTGVLGAFYPVTVQPPSSFVSGGTVNFTVQTNTQQILAYNPNGSGITVGTLCWIQMDDCGMYAATPFNGGGIFIMAGAVINPLGTPPNYLTNQTVDWVIGGSASVVSTTATVYNMMGVATVSGKMIVLGLNPDGSFTVISQSC